MLRLSSSSDIPDQTGRIAIITGGNSGVGYATATALANKGARVIVASRDVEKGSSAARAIGGNTEARHLDLSSLASVRRFAESIDEPIDYLINNAGAMSATRQLTTDGLESQIGVNHLGHFALTNLLLDRITRRVTTVTSAAHSSAHIDLDDLQWEHRPYSPFGAYGQSKLANLLFTAELQRRLTLAGSPVCANAAHPGWASTGFRITSGNRLLDWASKIATPLMAHGPHSGALPTLFATVADIPGDSYAGPSRFGVRGPAVVVERATSARDIEAARRLWSMSEALTATAFPLATSPERSVS